MDLEWRLCSHVASHTATLSQVITSHTFFQTCRLLEAAKRYALDIADGKRPRQFSLTRSDRLETYGEAVAILGFARAQACLVRTAKPSE